MQRDLFDVGPAPAGVAFGPEAGPHPGPSPGPEGTRAGAQQPPPEVPEGAGRTAPEEGRYPHSAWLEYLLDRAERVAYPLLDLPLTTGLERWVEGEAALWDWGRVAELVPRLGALAARLLNLRDRLVLGEARRRERTAKSQPTARSLGSPETRANS